MKNSELVLIGCDGSVIYKGRLTNLPINEELILSKSVEFFNDPAPCFIHRSAVMKRLYLEVEEYLENGLMAGGREWLWQELPCTLQQILQQKTQIGRVQYSSR